MDVGEWLRGLGLGQYETVFREHAIDMDVLADLKDGELAQIGVPLGDRKRLLKAIASLCEIEPSSSSRESAPPAETNLPSTPTPVPLAAGRDAERRPLTVMFCDLVNSTALASRLDAEDWRSLVNAHLDEASAVVTGLGGHVLKKLGDGLMALFGYPQAQENDTERAVRAALAIHRSLGELNSRNAASGIPELVARIGLETGPVVVDATGEVFGEAPNIAARVQAAAEPGTVLVTSTVQRQVAGLFIVEDRGAHELKGAPKPVTLYRILRVSGGRRRKGPRLLHAFRRPCGGPWCGRPPLGTRLRRRRTVRADRRRTRHRQVAPRRRISRKAWGGTALMDRMEFVSALAEHPAASRLRVGSRSVLRS